MRISRLAQLCLLSTMSCVSLGAQAATFCGSPAPAAVTANEFAGSGTAEDPYRIVDAAQLNSIGLAFICSFEKHFRLENDIDLAAAGITEFNSIRDFVGVFDGNGKTISNLKASRIGGLFANAGRNFLIYNNIRIGATIRNLKLTNVQIHDLLSKYGYPMGALIGRAEYVTVENVTVQGLVTGKLQVGGVIGSAYKSTLRNVAFGGKVEAIGSPTAGAHGGVVGAGDDVVAEDLRSTGRVFGNNNAGGLFGELRVRFNTAARLERSNSTAAVSGGAGVGGLVGYLEGAVVRDSYFRGKVRGQRAVGGLIGVITESFPDRIPAVVERCYSAAQISAFGEAYAIGGLFGTNYSGRINSVYWDKEVAGDFDFRYDYASRSFARTTEEMARLETYVGWDFQNVWRTKEDFVYPLLRRR